ncbi:RAMP superfamily CRISPR-associated protein [Bacillus ndiopicus]|uniref:RAMP superfamily CRISPR-associated protein n=1 Tax=Bacillus ndiopicus TaxID=1347368 RepID=UPI0005A86D82|nr:RAMP superfamily CRISPR-associated protein [Bacillus ndiopicus]
MPTNSLKNKLLKRTYIQIEGELLSPLLAGSGENNNTDMDVLRDEQGNPFIAGTSIAGAFRQWLTDKDLDEAVSSLFGAEKQKSKESKESKEHEDFRQSRIFISNVSFTDYKIKTRDHVKLENKVAEQMGKFEAEVIETGALFTMRLEYIERESSNAEQDKDLIKALLDAIDLGELKFGGKTHRGYGKLKIKKVYEKMFDYPKDVEEWLDWHWGWKEEDEKKALLENPQQTLQLLKVSLNIKQTLLIRDYKTKEDVDYTYLQANGKPVIPGATWAGAFRQRFVEILQDLAQGNEEIAQNQKNIVEQLFGSKHDKGNGMPSILQFEESVIENSNSLITTRNAIDRFSGATIDGALFTGKSICKGNTELIIRWRDDKGISSQVIQGILYWLIQDLHYGLLAIGGETAIGRGVFELNKPLDIPIDELKAGCNAAMTKLKGGSLI